VTGSEDSADIAPCAPLNLDTFAAMIKERPDAVFILADLMRTRTDGVLGRVVCKGEGDSHRKPKRPMPQKRKE